MPARSLALVQPGAALVTWGAGTERSAHVTHWGPRIALTLAVLALLALAYAGMWWGWRNRGRRQGSLAPLPAPPPPADLLLGPVEGSYVSTTTEGDWLDRVVVHRLGMPSRARLSVESGGVRVERDGEPPLWLPADRLVGVRREPGMAGKFVGEGGLVVLTWTLGEARLDTGFRTRYAEERDGLVSAVESLIPTRRSAR